jgi:hypothetical protein
MRTFVIVAALLLSTVAARPVAAQPTIINVGPCVPTPSGIVNSKFCPDGDDGTAGLPLLWSTIPSFVNKIEGTPFSVDLCAGYLTQIGSPNADITNVGAAFPSGWSLTGTNACTLNYSGTGTGSATVIMRATRSPVTSDSNEFTVESVPNLATDTIAPTIVTGVEVVLNGSNDPVIAFDAPTDVRVAGQDFSGMSTFTVRRNGTPLTPTALSGTASAPTYTTTDVGTVVGSDATQDGADWTHEGEGGTPTSGTDFVFTNATLTGDFTCTVKVASMTGGANGSRGAKVLARESTAGGARQVAAHLFPSGNVRTYTRSVTDGSVVQSGLVTLSSAAGWLRLTREGDVFTTYASALADGNDFGVVTEQTLGLSSTLLVGIATQSNEAGVPITVEYENLACTTRPRQTYTDTAGVPGSSSYDVINTDVQGNVAAPSVAVVAPDAPGGSGSDTPDYAEDVSTGLTLSLVNTPIADNAALDALLAGGASANCNKRAVLTAGAYNGNKTLNDDCPAATPFKIECATLGACTSTGVWSLSGASTIIEAMRLSNRVNCEGNRNKILRNQFIGTTGGAAIQFGPSNSPSVDFGCEIAYNLFESPNTTCLVVNGTGFKQAIKMYVSGSGQPQTVHRSIWIHHNYFHDWDSACLQGDAIELGESGTYDWTLTLLSGIYIEDNVFDGFSAGTNGLVVDMKVGGVVFRRNTLLNVGTKPVSQRVGPADIIAENYMPSTNIIVTGPDAKVVCNAVGTIRLRAGDMVVGELGGGQMQSADAHVASNIGSVVVGYIPTGGEAQYTEPALTTLIENHNGSVSFVVEDGTIDNRNGPSTYDCPAATQKPVADVGPDAISDASSGYRSGRDL